MIDKQKVKKQTKHRTRIPQTLSELWQFRLGLLLKELGKYSRLIINDHFSVILLVLLAFAGIYYQEVLSLLEGRQTSGILFLIKSIVLLVLFLVTSMGQPIWLTEEADKAYLFSLGKAWFNYWKQSSLLSLPLPLIVSAILTSLAYPILERLGIWSWTNFYWVILSVLILQLFSIVTYLFRARAAFILSPRLVFVYRFLVLTILIFMNEPLNLIIVALLLILYLGLFIFTMRTWSSQIIQFEYVVKQEARRKSRFYKWVSIFADVPQIIPEIHRRKVLDPILKYLDNRCTDAYSYHLSRLLLRHPVYSGIWLKVLIFIAFLMVWTSNPVFLFTLGLLGHLMTLVQLIPLLTYHQKQTMMRVFPLIPNYLKGFSTLMRFILYFQSLIYGLVGRNLGLILVWLLVAEGLLRFYVPWRYKALINH